MVQNKTIAYKEIRLPYQIPFSAGERTLIEQFNQLFPKTDIQLRTEGHSLLIRLRSVDVYRLREICSRLAAGSSRNLFGDVLDAVENIKSYGIKNRKRQYVAYDQERKVKARSKKQAKRGQYYYAKDNDFKRTNHPFPKEYENRIICGDSLSVLKELPDNCVDLVFTSPPYNFGLDYDNQPDDKYWDEYFQQLFRIFDETIRVLKWGGRIVVNVQPLFSDYIPIHHMISNFFISRKMIWKGEILWEKNNYNCKYTAWGSWKSPSSPYLKYTWEFLEIYAKGTLKKEGKKEDIDITADEFKEWVVAKWAIAPERNMKRYDHPAMFPEKLAERVIKLFSFRQDIVLDPFNGVGTTTAVAKRLRRRYLGIDISQEYCDLAAERTSRQVIQDHCSSHFITARRP